MMIKIEVTGNSIPEVADKLLAIGASLRGSNGGLLNSAAHPVGNVYVAKDADINSAALEVVEVEVAEENTPAAPAEEITPKPAEIVENTPAAPAEEIAVLNFETQVAPVVLLFVQKRSKEETSKILAEFGVERASMLDPALWPELVARLEAEMS
jgi:hypothetical protein